METLQALLQTTGKMHSCTNTVLDPSVLCSTQCRCPSGRSRVDSLKVEIVDCYVQMAIVAFFNWMWCYTILIPVFFLVTSTEITINIFQIALPAAWPFTSLIFKGADKYVAGTTIYLNKYLCEFSCEILFLLTFMKRKLSHPNIHENQIFNCCEHCQGQFCLKCVQIFMTNVLWYSLSSE